MIHFFYIHFFFGPLLGCTYCSTAIQRQGNNVFQFKIDFAELSDVFLSPSLSFSQSFCFVYMVSET